MSDQPIRGFEVTPAPKAGVIGRLFGRVPRETAFVEVRNILATTRFEQVRESDIAVALAKAKLLCRDATRELTGIFEHAALLMTVDRELSDSDRLGLAALQRSFELTDAEAASAFPSVVQTSSLSRSESAAGAAGPVASSLDVRFHLHGLTPNSANVASKHLARQH